MIKLDLSFEEAKKLSIKKWEFLSKYGFIDTDERGRDYEEFLYKSGLAKLPYECGFCAIYLGFDKDPHRENCVDCPLMIDGMCCADDGHVYMEHTKLWDPILECYIEEEKKELHEQSKEIAKRMLNLIKNAKEK